MKKAFFGLLLGLFLGLFFYVDVHATEYPDFTTVDNIKVESNDGQCSYDDLKTSWVDYAFVNQEWQYNDIGSAGVNREQAYQNFKDAIAMIDEGSSWFVSQYKNYDRGYGVRIGWRKYGDQSRVIDYLENWGGYYVTDINQNILIYEWIDLYVYKVNGMCRRYAEYNRNKGGLLSHHNNGDNYSSLLFFAANDYIIADRIKDKVDFLPGLVEVEEDPLADSVLKNDSLSGYGLSSALVAPLNFIKSLQDSHCSSPVIPSFFEGGSPIVLWCMDEYYENYFNSIRLIYQTVLTGITVYYISIKILGRVKKFQDPKDDSIEVIKL